MGVLKRKGVCWGAPCKRRTNRPDALSIQGALVFYANPPLSEGGTCAGCTVQAAVIRLARFTRPGGTECGHANGSMSENTSTN